MKKFALRKFPTLFLYPAGVSGGLFLPVAFHVNRTFEDYRAEMMTISELTYSVTHDVDGLHPHVVSFLEIQVMDVMVTCLRPSETCLCVCVSGRGLFCRMKRIERLRGPRESNVENRGGFVWRICDGR